MLELTRSTIDVKLDDKVYKLRAPTYAEGLEYKKQAKDCVEDETKLFELLGAFLAKLGFPVEASKTMEVGHLEKILEFVLGTKKK